MPGRWAVAVGRSLGRPRGSLVREALWPGAVRGLRRYFPPLRHRAMNYPGICRSESLLFLFPVSVFSCLLPDLMLLFFIFALYLFWKLYGLFF